MKGSLEKSNQQHKARIYNQKSLDGTETPPEDHLERAQMRRNARAYILKKL